MLREILLTGATGVLGSELCAQLLADPDTRLWLLLRARSSQELAARLGQVAAYAARAGVGDVERRLRAVRGDVRLPQLGLDPADYAGVAGSITHVVHSAADVRFDRSLEDARSTAVSSVEHIVALVRRAARPAKLECISTVGVAGCRTGRISEEPQSSPQGGFRNAYEQSKAEAEQWLLAEMRDGLNATIHRPAMIVGHSRDGRIQAYQGFYFLVDYFLGLKSDNVVPACDHLLMDTIPVDYVAKAIDHSTRDARLDGAILHLCSGPRAWNIGQVTAYARALLLERGRELPAVTALPLDRFMEHLAVKSAAGSRFHEALAQFESYFADFIEFDNRRAAELLAPAGIEVPPVESYLDTVLTAYWASRRKLPRA
jgi:thioester reductase-like protein